MSRTAKPTTPEERQKLALRRARVRTKKLREQLANTREAYEMQVGLGRHLAKQRAEAMRELDLMQRYLTPFSVLAPTRVLQHGGRPGDVIELDIVPPLGGPGEMDRQATLERIPLHEFMASVDQDMMRRAVHAVVKYRNGEMRYAISEKTLMGDRGALAEILAKRIAPQLAAGVLEKAGR
jgi:hypothetical protein